MSNSMNLRITVALVTCLAATAFSQQWTNYTNGSEIRALETDGEILWVGTA